MSAKNATTTIPLSKQAKYSNTGGLINWIDRIPDHFASEKIYKCNYRYEFVDAIPEKDGAHRVSVHAGSIPPNTDVIAVKEGRSIRIYARTSCKAPLFVVSYLLPATDKDNLNDAVISFLMREPYMADVMKMTPVPVMRSIEVVNNEFYTGTPTSPNPIKKLVKNPTKKPGEKPDEKPGRKREPKSAESDSESEPGDSDDTKPKDDATPTTVMSSEIRKYKDQFVVVKGHVQSGKTKFITYTSLWMLQQGLHSVIILRNSTDDKDQIENRAQDIKSSMDKYLKKRGFEGKFPISIVDGDKASLYDFTTGSPKIFLYIAHPKALSKLSDILESQPSLHQKFTMFIDEVDMVYSEKTKGKEQLEIIRSNAYSTFGVSATVLDPLLKEKVRYDSIIFLPKPSDYVGINKLYPEYIPETSKLITTNTQDIFERDPYLKTMLEKFASCETENIESAHTYYDETSKTYVTQYHPRIWLARVAIINEKIQECLYYTSTTHNQAVSMSYTGQCIRVYVPGHTKVPIVLKNGLSSSLETVPYQDKSVRVHVFTKTRKRLASPGMVLEWLYENGGYDKYPRIIIFAGDMAARSISFGAANYTQCQETGQLWWHLTDMYALVADSMDIPELHQCLGRLCVRKSDMTRLRLYVTETVYDDLLKSYYMQEELIKRGIDIIKQVEEDAIKEGEIDEFNNQESHLFMSDIIQVLPISREKVPNRDIIKKEGEEPINLSLVASDKKYAGSWPLGKYARYEDNGTRVKHFIEKKQQKIREQQAYEILEELERQEGGMDQDTSSDREIPREEFIRLTTRMFPKWSKGDSKIARFMQGLDPTKVYSKREILSHGLSVNDVTCSSNDMHHGNGQIMKKVKTGYKLYKELLPYIEKYM